MSGVIWRRHTEQVKRVCDEWWQRYTQSETQRDQPSLAIACQSLGWARLWLQNPSVCLLDEPTAALDQRLEATLISRLEGWMEGRTVVIATHRMPILSLTDRVMVLQNGRLAVDGPRDQVLAHLATPAGGGL
jgi:ABC-type protease/lipase transport system fused ATPase/permease subunit